MNTVTLLLSYWWVLVPILAIIFYKFVLRFFFGMVIIPENKIGLVTKKFVLFGPNRSLPDGKIIALNGEAGFQVDPLPPGLYWFYWIWQYSIEEQSFIEIPRGKVGLISSRDGAELPTGRILARKVSCDSFQDARAFLTNGGQRGRQTYYLNNGVYRINTLLFECSITDISVIDDGKVGIVTMLDGSPLDPGSIAGKIIPDHNNYQDVDAFLENGGQRGMQIQVIQAGSYTLNPWAIQVEQVDITEIPVGHVGVVISYVGDEGKDITGSDFKHGNIVSKGQKGVWVEAMDPGKHPINTYTHKVELVPTTNLVLNWANGRNESHNLDRNLSTITVRSSDGFPFNLDVSQIIHIPSTEAPKVISRFGSMQNLVSQVLEPTIGNYFRNSAQRSDVIGFLKDRQERQDQAKKHIEVVLEQYNVHAVDTLIGDINPPKDLMDTLTARKIAEQEEITFETQRKAQDQRKTLESAKALADIQGKMVAAQQSVEISQREAEAAVKKSEGDAKSIELKAQGAAKAMELEAAAKAKAKKMLAEADATQIKLTGEAEASKIEAIGKSTAESYRLQVEAMGSDNFSKYKITEEIGKNQVKVIPDILISGNDNGGPLSGLIGMELLKMINDKKVPETTSTETVVTQTKVKGGSPNTGTNPTDTK